MRLDVKQKKKKNRKIDESFVERKLTLVLLTMNKYDLIRKIYC